MGSYINIGLASRKINFKKSVIDLLKGLKCFAFMRVHFPVNNCDDWTSFDDKECSVEEAFEYCHRYEMSYFVGGFMLDNIHLNNVFFTVEKKEDDIESLIIKIPEEEISKSIDEFEHSVIEFLKTIKGFVFAFCDSEAHLDDDKYSVYVQYLDCPRITYGNWKIDGYTER